MNSLFNTKLPGCSCDLSGHAHEVTKFGRVAHWEAEGRALCFVPGHKAIKITKFLKEIRKKISRTPARSDQSWKIRGKLRKGQEIEHGNIY